MKRCPQCQFIYPDTDDRCDFDQTTLAVVSDSEIDAASRPGETAPISELATAHSNTIRKRLGRKGLPIAVAAGLTIGVVLFGFYIRLSHPATTTPAAPVVETPQSQPVVPATAPVDLPSPLPSVEPSPSPSVTPKNSPSPGRVATAHSGAGAGPVSTGSESATKAGAAKPVILLTTGGRVEADEVWQTKDGVWYRANGVVTLLKRNRVKSIVRR